MNMTPANSNTNKRPRRTQAERTATSDAAMFKAATKLVLEKGVDGMTLKEVGELAGYSRGLASYRFGSKENLVQELLRRFQKDWAATINKATRGKRGLDAYLSGIQAWEDFMLRDTDEYRVGQLLRFQRVRSGTNSGDGMTTTLKLQQDTLTKWLKEALEDGDLRSDVDARQLALQHSSFMFGTMYQLLILPESIDVKDHIAGYLSRFREQLIPGEDPQRASQST